MKGAIVIIIGVLVLGAIGIFILDHGNATPQEIETASKNETEMVDSSMLYANQWQWRETAYANGDVVTAQQPEKFIITFTEDGTFSATTDCNNGSGSYEVVEGSLSFGPIASTKKACFGETQEQTFWNMLSLVDGYTVTEEGILALLLAEDSGSIIFDPLGDQ